MKHETHERRITFLGLIILFCGILIAMVSCSEPEIQPRGKDREEGVRAHYVQRCPPTQTVNTKGDNR